jgi:23S rRNA (cytidine2498-2'-O)-methyltransferase
LVRLFARASRVLHHVLTSQFVFVSCQPGAETALKRELAQKRPSWSPAYQRPGLVTFRSGEAVTPELALESVFARQYGMSLGSAADIDAALARIRELPESPCLQVVERAPADPDATQLGGAARALEDELRARAPVADRDVAREGELVLTVVVGEGDPLLLGLHRQHRGRSPHPGARFPIALPEAAPSRAYLKIEEAIQSFELPMRAGDTALEIGAAPGGAAYALLQRGIRVFAVDPAVMDLRLLERVGPSGARVIHLQQAMRDLDRKELPGRIDWLLMDVHLAPQIALRAARRLSSELRSSLCGAVLTMKLNDWSFADKLDDFVAQTLPMGLLEPRAKQLPSHRQEVAIVGLTKLGTKRLHRAATRV